MLKQLMIQKKIDQRKALLESFREKQAEFETRSAQLEAAIEEASTDEEVAAVEESISALEEEKRSHDAEKSKLEGEIRQLEEELEELNKKAPKNKEEEDNNERGKQNMNKEKLQELRSAINAFIRSKGREVRQMEGFKLIDGGALVPEELLSPEKVPEDVVDLLNYVQNVSVSSSSGKYPVIKKSGSKMNTVAELEANPELAKPTITDIDFSIETYRGYIPISQEVIDDANYDIVGLIDEEIKDQALNTRNAAIAAVLKTATPKTVTSLDDLITLLNTGFKTAYQVKLYVSQSLFNELDLMKDGNGRYLLQDDITVASGKRLKGKEIVVLDDEMIGEAAGDLVGFIGDAKAFCKFFNRKQTYVKWVDHNVYGQMLAGFVRFDVRAADTDAGYYVTYTGSGGGVEG